MMNAIVIKHIRAMTQRSTRVVKYPQQQDKSTVTMSAGDDEEAMVWDNVSFVCMFLICVLLASFPEEFGYDLDIARMISDRVSPPPIDRERKTVNNIFKELGPSYTRRAYRMSEDAFWFLHRKLYAYLRRPTAYKRNHLVKVKGAANGIITTPVRLSCAIRYFAGGRPEDIALVHGISHTEVFHSVWMVVDAINECEELAFGFPEDHVKQRAIAEGFKQKSWVGFDNCVGAIDGLLIWTERFSDEECAWAGCGPKKFYCGHKCKYGFNMQGTCDSQNRFLDVSIIHPASTSDFLAFSTSSLFHKMERPGFLAPGLCLYGDAAYVNCNYFVSPYKNVSGGSRDDYNFFHSQLRINIECAFGQLVQRWGLLRRALPSNFGIRKSTALVIALCRLHRQ
jgi:DDE superfamily endonuclease